MDPVAAAQNAIRLIQAAVGQGIITENQVNELTADHIGEIGILETPEQVRNYVHITLVETAEQRAARIEQARAALEQLRNNLINQARQRADLRNQAQQLANVDLAARGGRSRRRRTRKTRK